MHIYIYILVISRYCSFVYSRFLTTNPSTGLRNYFSAVALIAAHYDLDPIEPLVTRLVSDADVVLPSGCIGMSVSLLLESNYLSFYLSISVYLCLSLSISVDICLSIFRSVCLMWTILWCSCVICSYLFFFLLSVLSNVFQFIFSRPIRVSMLFDLCIYLFVSLSVYCSTYLQDNHV